MEAYKTIYTEELERFREETICDIRATRQGQIREKLARLDGLLIIQRERQESYLRKREPRTCWRCNGEKTIEIECGGKGQPKLKEVVPCPACEGSGKVPGEDLPGAPSGLIVRKQTETGRINSEVDLGLLREISKLEQEILELTGEAPGSKLDITSGGKALHGTDLSRLGLDDLEALHGILAKASAEPSGS